MPATYNTITGEELSDNRTDVSVEVESPLADLMRELSQPLLRAETETAIQPKWEPAKLNVRHREIMRRMITGATHLQIAEEMGLHPVTVGLISRTAIFRAELEKLELEADGKVTTKLENMADEATDTLKVIMRTAKAAAIRKAAADSILDRAGYGKVEKRLNLSVSGEDVIRELGRRRRELLNAQNSTRPGDTNSERDITPATNDRENSGE